MNPTIEMKRVTRIIALIFVSILLVGMFTACKKTQETDTPAEGTQPQISSVDSVPNDDEPEDEGISLREEDIIILYTNDVHTGISENLGYPALAAYRSEMLSATPYVMLVDNGDAVQGNYISASSNGTAIIQAMNELGYDICIMGNHEFDYGLDGLCNLIDTANADYLNCSISYTGNNRDPFADMNPYTIRDMGGTKIGFVGVTTPDTIESIAPSIVKEDGETVVDFSRGENGQVLYTRIQAAVDDAREEGADYVILMAHLGINEDNGEYNSLNVIANTYGIDAVLDGHSHSVIPCDEVENLRGETVLLTSTGTKMQTFGKLVITPDGTITTELVEEYEGYDEEIAAWIKNMEDVYSGLLGEPRFTLQDDLLITDEEGLRLVRVTEVGLGNFVADAYREVLGADIGMCNGGGIRASLKAGNVSEMDLINVNPFGNLMCVIEASGSEILDMLEYFYRYCSTDYIQDGVVVCEFGSFMHISGLKCVVDTSVPSGVILDENDNLIGVGDTRRVCEVYVLQNGEYVEIDPETIYSIATSNYMAKNGGCGMEVFLAGHNLLVDESVSDYEVLLTYATEYLGGDLSRYNTTEGRIVLR